jgi:hypothetical protein
VGDRRIFLHGDLAHESEDRRIAQFGRQIRAGRVVRWRERRDKAQTRGERQDVVAITMVAPQHNSWMCLFL